jgi:DNA-binding HxlR family transcriptional regulator
VFGGEKMKNDEKVSNLEKSLFLIGKKFDLLIIDSIARHKNRVGFNQILNDIVSINPRTLSVRLKELEENKLVKKGLIIGTPVKTEYSLNAKAKKLLPIIKELKDWYKEK